MLLHNHQKDSPKQSQSSQFLGQYALSSQRKDSFNCQIFDARCLKTGKPLTIKLLKKSYKTIQKVKKIKEIQALKILSPHQNIIDLLHIHYDEMTGRVALVFQHMEQNLHQYLMTRDNLSMQNIKYLMHLLLKSIAHIHSNGIFHRQIRLENVLISGKTLKLSDFASCKGIQRQLPHTDYISCRWYRSPECLLTDGYYDSKMDIWAFGCVLFETIAKYHPFAGKNQLDQIHRIHKVLGTPSAELLNKFRSRCSHMKPEDWNFPQKKGYGLKNYMKSFQPSKELTSLLEKLLEYDPEKRITAVQALKHEFFAEFDNERSENKDFLTESEEIKKKACNWMHKAKL